MALLFRTHVQLATTSLRLNRIRSFLTALGIAIGVASIVLILSFTGSINLLITGQIEKAGSDLIVIRPSSTKDAITSIVDELTASNQYLKSTLSLKDSEIISKINSVTHAVPIAASENTLINNGNSVIATIVATHPDIKHIISLPIKSGQFLNPSLKEETAVIGHDLALKLFGAIDTAITKTFTWQAKRFMVVGVLEKINDPINFNNINFDNTVIINANYATKLTELQVQQINVKVNTPDLVPTAIKDIEAVLSESKLGERNFSILSGSDISHPAGSLFAIISSMLAIVATISLIVGGIGVMNIMLVSVSERTHEIGIRKAVGASSGSILLQFLFESLILSLLGGILGFLFGYVIAFLISLVTPFAPFVSWEILLITSAMSAFIGVAFGIYPALKASLKNPIQSLKHYR